ncbi:MAG TPA: hypothetical protein PKA64_01895 [Myxococcota bacterium]|nr:hypothetical protein [Myxococcota bacterium]
MSTPFLLQFSRHLVQRLVAEGQVELTPDGEEATIEGLAAHLAQAGRSSLVTEITRGLLASPTVVELFADDDALKELVTDLAPTAARGGAARGGAGPSA